MNLFKIKDRMWKQDITLLVNCSDKDIEGFVFKKYGVHLSKGNYERDGCYFSIENKRVTHRFIYIEKFDWSVISQGMLAHELLHVVFAVLGDHGIYHGAKTSEESFTYYLQDLMTDALWKLKKLHPRIKKK